MKIPRVAYDDQVKAFARQVTTHSNNAEEIAASIVDCQRVLDEARNRLRQANTEQAAFSENAKLLRHAIEEVEKGRVPKELADDWITVFQIDSELVEKSFARTGDTDVRFALEKILPQDEMASMRNHLSRPTFERFIWTKGDYVVTFVSLIVGLSLEIVNMAYRANSPIDQDGSVSKWFSSNLHKHEPDNPIDFQGPGFGGQFHRIRSRGHDLFRFFEAVDQASKGEFRGTRWSYGTPVEVISKFNQFGKSYPEMDWTCAFINVVTHLIADFFSAHSLPLPLSSVVYENCGRDLRKFVHDLYENGYNMRHVAINTVEVFLSYLTVEVWLWMQYGFDNLKNDSVGLKRTEMRCAILGFLSGFNAAGCFLFQNPFLINIPVLAATTDSAIKYFLLKCKQNSWVFKEIRNIDDLAKSWKEFEKESFQEQIA